MPDVYLTDNFAASAKALGKVRVPTRNNYHAGMDASLSSAMAAAVACMKDTLRDAEAYNARRTFADGRKTLEGNYAEIEKLADKFAETFPARFERAGDGLKTAIADAEAAWDRSVGIKSTAQDGAIAQCLGQMKAEDRASEVHRIFAEGDKVGIAALVNSHRLVSGIDPVALAPLLDAFKQAAAPAEYAKLQAHKQGLEWLDAGKLDALRFSAESYHGLKSASEKRKRAVAVLGTYGITLDND